MPQQCTCWQLSIVPPSNFDGLSTAVVDATAAEPAAVLSAACRVLPAAGSEHPSVVCCLCRFIACYAQVVNTYVFWGTWTALVLMYWEVRHGRALR